MAIALDAIRSAITEVLEGAGKGRQLPAQLFADGIFDGQPEQARQARSLTEARHRFDIEFGDVTTHQASPVSSSGSRRIVNLPITIKVDTRLKTAVQEIQRSALLAQTLSDCEDAAQALAYPNVLTLTENGIATGIAGGLMRGEDNGGAPTARRINVNWESRRIESEIVGSAIVVVEQNEVAA